LPLADDLNAKHPIWNSVVSNPMGANLLYINKFEISVPQCSTHYCPAENGDMLNIVVHKNIRVSEVIVSDILDLDHLPFVFNLLNHVRPRNLSDPVDKFTDWERFQCLTSELISPRIQINSGEEADKVAHGFTASIAVAYRLSRLCLHL
jgi:hypothetical protein